MYHTTVLDTSSHKAGRTHPARETHLHSDCQRIDFTFAFPVKFRVCFSKPAFIWTCLNVGIHRAGREEATVREFVPSGVQQWILDP